MKKIFIIALIIIIAGLIYIGMHFSGNQTSTVSVNASNATNNASQNIKTSNATIATSPVSKSNNDNTNTNTNTNNTTSNSSSNTNNNDSNSNTTNSTKQDNNQFTMNLGNGNFTQLRESTTFFYGQVGNGASMIINLGSLVNNQIMGTEYYLSEPNEKFNVKISSLGPNKYIIYEFYHGQHTGTFKVSSNPNYGMTQLTGTYIKAGTNEESTVTLSSNNLAGRHTFQLHGLMDNYPFYSFNVAGTNTTWINTNNSNFLEYYSGDPNAFTIQPDMNYNGEKYSMVYTETYNGVKTGEYYLNYNSNTNEHYGKYVKYVNGQVGQSYNIVLQGSIVPTYSL